MKEEIETITRWRDNQRVIEVDTSNGIGIRPSNVESKIRADLLDEVLELFKGELRGKYERKYKRIR